jgi:hypothetical protein
MGQQTDIEIFLHGGSVNQAYQVVADMIKFYYLDGITVLDRVGDVYSTFIKERERLRAYPESELLSEYPNCALKRLSYYANVIDISRCSDLQRYLSTVGSDYAGFFYDVCFALARELPTAEFSATSRFHMTVTDHIEETRARYDTEELVFEQTSYFLYGDGGYDRDVARWKLLPRCIAVNGKKE